MTARDDCSVCYLTRYWPCFYHMSIPTSAHIRTTSTARNSATAANRAYECVSFLTQNWLWN